MLDLEAPPPQLITTSESSSNSSESSTTSPVINDFVPGLRSDLVDEVVPDCIPDVINGTDANSTSTNGTSCDDVIDKDAGPTITPPSVLNKLDYNYKEIISKSILFYEAQRSGKLGDKNRIPWRGDSALYDKGNYNGSDVDLTGGYYDAGDNLKFGYPMAYSITVLSWGLVHYWDAYRAAGEFDNMLNVLIWGTDWLNKTVVLDEKGVVQEVYVLVGDPEWDHSTWDRPESIVQGQPRPSFKLTPKKRGTDCAAEYAAAFAAASLCYKRALAMDKFEPGLPYIRRMVKNAEALWRFADSTDNRDGSGKFPFR